MERAAIIEYDGNVPRAQAEVLAFAELNMRGAGRGYVRVEIEARSAMHFASQVAAGLGLSLAEIIPASRHLRRVTCYPATGRMTADDDQNPSDGLDDGRGLRVAA